MQRRGKNLPSKRNLADYVGHDGDFDIVKYLSDHIEYFPGLFSVCVGELCPHLSTEVDCESLFSQAGYKSHPRRTRTDIRNYERLVVTKHRMQNIYIPPSKVQELFLARWKSNDWKENEERDDKEFLEIEKSIYMELFPNAIDSMKSEEEELKEVNGDVGEVGDADGSMNSESESYSSGNSGVSSTNSISSDSSDDEHVTD